MKLNQPDGSLQVFKHKGEKLLGCAEGKDFRLTMTQVALLGIEDDEPTSFSSRATTARCSLARKSSAGV
jgi:hypothetical protein